MDGDEDGAVPADDHGGVTVEYIIMVTFIAVVITVAVALLGASVLGLFNEGVELPWDGLPE